MSRSRYIDSRISWPPSRICWFHKQLITQSDMLAPHRTNHSVRYLGPTPNESLSAISWPHTKWITQCDILAPQRMNHSVPYRGSTTLSVCSHTLSKETERADKTIHCHILSLHRMEAQYQAQFALKPDNYSIRSCVGSTVGYPIRSCVGSTVGYPIRSCVGSTVGYRIRSCVGSTVGYRIRSCVGSTVGYRIRSCVGSTVGYRIPTLQVAVQLIATHTHTQYLCKEFHYDNDAQLRFAVWQPHVSTNGVQTVSHRTLLFCESLNACQYQWCSNCVPRNPSVLWVTWTCDTSTVPLSWNI
jgi:hypothetical protein